MSSVLGPKMTFPFKLTDGALKKIESIFPVGQVAAEGAIGVENVVEGGIGRMNQVMAVLGKIRAPPYYRDQMETTRCRISSWRSVRRGRRRIWKMCGRRSTIVNGRRY